MLGVVLWMKVQYDSSTYVGVERQVDSLQTRTWMLSQPFLVEPVSDLIAVRGRVLQ